MSGRLTSVEFSGPAGPLEGLWKEPPGAPIGSAVFAHPHPLHGGTLHNKVVYRAARALAAAGYRTLRFNFRGVGLSAGTYDLGRGETADFRAALDETEREAGLPIVAGGFSFGSAVGLKATVGDPRVRAFLGVGLAVATELGRNLPRPEPPALFVVGEHDAFGPPEQLREFVGERGQVVVIPGADHFFDGKLEALEQALHSFLEALPKAGAR